MINGTVKTWSPSKGWGFIEREGLPDLFVHSYDVEGTISDGDKVEFEVCEGKRGEIAMNVKIIKKAPVLRKIIY